MRNARWHFVVVAIVIGILVAGAELGMDWLVHSERRAVYASDFFVGAVAAIASGAALDAAQRRRKALMLRLQAIEDVNHHVRNALTAVTYSAALKGDPELSAVVQDANDRVDWVLREVLPHSAHASEERLQPSKWADGAKVSPAGRKANSASGRG